MSSKRVLIGDDDANRAGTMRSICELIKAHIPEVIAEWERLVREQPWFSLPPDHRIDHLPDVVVGLVEASLCRPQDVEAHRQKIRAACEHGTSRRARGVPEHLIFTEYHLLRQAIWYYLCRTLDPADDRVVDAMLRIDSALSTATNAAMWGYHRAEVEAMGRWEESVARILESSLLLRRG
jgi:hypothetical protein